MHRNSRRTHPRLHASLLVLLLGLCGAPHALPWVTQQVQAPGVEYHVFDSAAVGAPVSYHVYLPPHYATQSDRRFPVLYWLHGSNGVLGGIEPMAQRIGQAIANGHLPPLIVVFPNGLPQGMWVDAASGLQPVESMLVQDLLAEVDARFRTIATPAARVLDGFSMGGYGAARLGLRYPQLFAGFSMVGAGPLQLDFLEPNRDFVPIDVRRALLTEVYGDSAAIFAASSPLVLSALHGPGLPGGHRIRMIIGTGDSMLRTNREFHAHLLQLGVEHEYVELPDVEHNMLQAIAAMGPEFWRFHREALAGASEALFPSGLGGAWWDAQRSGQGLLLEQIQFPGSDPAEQLHAYWFTYSETGDPLYLVGAGGYMDGRAVIDLVRTRGGRHGARLDPATVVSAGWGRVVIEAIDCERLRLEYISPEAGEGSLEMTRFATSLGGSRSKATCEELPEPRARR